MTNLIDTSKLQSTSHQLPMFPELDIGTFEQEVLGHHIYGEVSQGRLVYLQVGKLIGPNSGEFLFSYNPTSIN